MGFVGPSSLPSPFLASLKHFVLMKEQRQVNLRMQTWKDVPGELSEKVVCVSVGLRRLPMFKTKSSLLGVCKCANAGSN